ncbi:hypothetical protein AB1Y20_013340 [Prymnesium parvum]|uniref:Uncharacterized protein n=1 Tax=Prymnesium parvum TaxID=97485 RepID=A0AB34ILF5_PRYPA
MGGDGGAWNGVRKSVGKASAAPKEGMLRRWEMRSKCRCSNQPVVTSQAHLAAASQRAEVAEQRATQARAPTTIQRFAALSEFAYLHLAHRLWSRAREKWHIAGRRGTARERDAMQVELERLRRAMKRDGQAALMQQEQQAEELHTRLATCEQQKGAALRESVQQAEKARRAEEEATRLAEALRLAEEKAAQAALVSHKSAESVEAMRAELQELRGELDRSVAQGVSTKNTMEAHGRAVPKLVDVQAVRHAAEAAADCIHAEAHRAFEARVRMLEQVRKWRLLRYRPASPPQCASCVSHRSAAGQSRL